MEYLAQFYQSVRGELVIKLALIVVGVTQWTKSFAKSPKIPTWVWAIVMAVLAVLVIIFEYFCPVVNLVLMVICVSQLGYEYIIQTAKMLFTRVVTGHSGKLHKDCNQH